jgi:hypothetical protein
MQLGEMLDGLCPRTAGVLGVVPFLGCDGRQELLHGGLVVEQRSVEVARVPVDEDAAKVEDNGADPRLHRPGGYRTGERTDASWASACAFGTRRAHTVGAVKRSARTRSTGAPWPGSGVPPA